MTGANGWRPDIVDKVRCYSVTLPGSATVRYPFKST